MDINKRTVIEMRINKVMENLKKNNMLGIYATTREKVVPMIKEFLHEGDSTAVGGSSTLFECGVIDLLRSGNYNFLDRHKPGLSNEDMHQIFIQSLSTDVFLCSCNAITEAGELYNVDGNSNRVAAIMYGPKSVIIVAGYNKIVKDLDEAITRVKKMAAPPNSLRRGAKTYCAEKGECQAFLEDCPGMTSGCKSPDRMCCNFVVSAQQRIKNRIKVIIVGEDLGY